MGAWLAWSMTDLGTGAGPLKVLAVVGGAALGALLTGLLAQLLTRALTTQRLPTWPLNGARLGGGLLVGWLVWLWAFGPGGGGLGGPGGGGTGGGGDTTKKAGKEPKEKDPPGKDKTPGKTAPGTPADTVRVEVLGTDVLRKIAGGKEPDLERRYRLDGRGAGKLYTLEEVQARIAEVRRRDPALKKIQIVLYTDSPDKTNTDYVEPLAAWIKGQVKEKYDLFDEPPKPAPLP
jgi:hypothetical protein